MKLTKRKTPRLPRDAEFCSQIIDVSKTRNSHYLLVKLNAGDEKKALTIACSKIYNLESKNEIKQP